MDRSDEGVLILYTYTLYLILILIRMDRSDEGVHDLCCSPSMSGASWGTVLAAGGPQ